MKEIHKLHYRVVDGHGPTDGEGYVCLTLMKPHDEHMKTFAVVDTEYSRLVQKLKAPEKRRELNVKLGLIAERAIENGAKRGTIRIAI